MLYEDIRRGCTRYHQGKDGYAYDKAYANYFEDKNQAKWDNPDTLDLAEAGKLLAFLNQWETLMPARLTDFQSALKKATAELTPLMDKSILDLDLNELSIGDAEDADKIRSIFLTVAKCGGDSIEATATSKILHTINPHGFVMWDRKIREHYAQPLLGKKTPNIGEAAAREYACRFLPAMQLIAKRAIEQVMAAENHDSRDDAIKSLTPCGNSLAKVIDEYNFVISRRPTADDVMQKFLKA